MKLSRSATRIAVLVSFAATIGCDRVTKHVASEGLAGEPPLSLLADTVRLAYAENAGGFLSLGANLPPAVRTLVFTILAGVALLALAALMLRGHWTGWRLVGLSLLVAGGLSNWTDRAVRGSVVDFLNVGVGPLRTGVFNFADVAILLGAAVFALTAALEQGGRAPPDP